MINDDFYVSLPSNVSMKEYPSNKQSNYTTLLEEPIELPINYQVALVEISNFSNFKVQLGKVSFKNPYFGSIYENRTEKIEFDLTLENGISLKEFCDTLNYEIENNFIKSEYLYRQKISYESDQQELKKLADLNTAKKDQKRPILNVLKKENLFEIIDTAESVFNNKFIKSGGVYDAKLFRYRFANLDELSKFFDLVVVNSPPPRQDNHANYFIDKVVWLSKDSYIKNGSKSRRSITDDFISEDYYSKKFFDFMPTEPSTKPEIKELAEKVNKNMYEGIIPRVRYFGSNTIAIEAHSEITFEGLLSKVLNNNDINKTTLNNSKLFSLPPYLQLIKYILVYTDIIEAQYFGNVRSSILRTVNIKANNQENVTFFDNPHYLNVNKTRIDTINITI